MGQPRVYQRQRGAPHAAESLQAPGAPRNGSHRLPRPRPRTLRRLPPAAGATHRSPPRPLPRPRHAPPAKPREPPAKPRGPPAPPPPSIVSQRLQRPRRPAAAACPWAPHTWYARTKSTRRIDSWMVWLEIAAAARGDTMVWGGVWGGARGPVAWGVGLVCSLIGPPAPAC
jgi:hypothetical protein